MERAHAEQRAPEIFRVQDPDLALSPFTGLTRRHWRDAARYLLAGAFGHVRGRDEFLVFPRQPGKSYAGGPTEKLEGLCRTLLTAAVLLREDRGLSLHGIGLADYYRHHLALLVDPASPSHVAPRASRRGGPQQALVELGGLALALELAPEVLWDPLPAAIRDRLAETMRSHAEGPTVPSNWRWFNVLVLSFLERRGYPVDGRRIDHHLRGILGAYRGDGWYQDGPSFDYYSLWAFQTYGVLWAALQDGGRRPRQARALLERFREMARHAPRLFDRGGEQIAWGRSALYRFAAVAPLALTGLLDDAGAGVDLGWLRRICSGALLQYLGRPGVMRDGVPTLGVYGPFEPAVQAYSCRASVYWMGKAFLGLLVPEDRPFWTAREGEGPWARYEAGTLDHRWHRRAAILVTHDPSMGSAELRAPCHAPARGSREPFRGGEAYNRLAYHSAFPWQADGPAGEVAMSLAVRDREGGWEPLRLFTPRGFAGGILRRDAVLESDRRVRWQLADIPLPGGVLRVDRYVGDVAAEVRLGHYALPRLGPALEQERRTVGGAEALLLGNGRHQLAIVPLAGWERPEALPARGLHPEAEESAVPVAGAACPPAGAARVLLALLLWKEAGAPWRDEELRRVAGWEVGWWGRRVTVRLADGRRLRVRF